MRFLLELADARRRADLVAAGRAVHVAGLDGISIPHGASPAPLLTAAALASAVPDILVAAEVEVGERHPVELAEEAAVVDLASGGRLVLIARPAAGRMSSYAEALDLLRRAWTPRPFRVEGPTWPVPARLQGHAHPPEHRTRVTPSPAGVRVELWGAGAGHDTAAGRGLGAVAERDVDPDAIGDAWKRAAVTLGPAAIGAPRARHEDWHGAAALRRRLLSGRAGFGQDWAVVAAPASAARTIAREVRPYVQLDALPPGLDELWAGASSAP